MHTVRKIYSIHEEVPESFLDATDLDSYFIHKICHSSQSHHRRVWVKGRWNKNSFAINLFRLRDEKSQHRFIKLVSFYKTQRTSQQIQTDDSTETQIWNYTHIIKSQTFCPLLKSFSRTFQQSNTFIILFEQKKKDVFLSSRSSTFTETNWFLQKI